MAKDEAKVLVAKKLRTGEIAIWDDADKKIILIADPGHDQTTVARVIRGGTFKALQESLGDVVVLV